MIKVLTWMIAILVAVLPGLVAGAMAKGKDPGKAPAGKSEMKTDKASQTIEGKVTKVDRNRVTLDDGTTLTIPSSVAMPGGLKPGTPIVAEYHEEGEQKVATSLKIKS